MLGLFFVLGLFLVLGFDTDDVVVDVVINVAEIVRTLKF